jgi:hypothetical protein
MGNSSFDDDSIVPCFPYTPSNIYWIGIPDPMYTQKFIEITEYHAKKTDIFLEEMEKGKF